MIRVPYQYLLCFLFFAVQLQGQVIIRGLSFWNEPELQIHLIDNHLSREKQLLQTVKPDSLGIFNCLLDLKEISAVQICGKDKCALLYTQPKSRYIIELPLDANTSFYNETEKEVELLFYQLDTNDINYRILGFEAWMDNYISDIYQLKEVRSHEFVLKVMAFKTETTSVYGKDTCAFLKDYIKYSVGQTIDNFSIIGGPTKEEKFEFYLQTDTINFKQPKLIEYALSFYEHYDSQLEPSVRIETENAIAEQNVAGMISSLQKDAFIHNAIWAEFVALQLILDYEHDKRIDKNLAIHLLKQMMVNGQQLGLRSAAHFYWLQLSKLSEGQTWDRAYLENDLKLKLKPNQLIYLHHYIPGNQRCILELPALKKLAKRYENKLQIITFYPIEQPWSNADKKAFEGTTWQQIGLPKNSSLWQQLSWSSAPAYVLLDPTLRVLNLNALGPLPDARTQTIDLVINRLLRDQ